MTTIFTPGPIVRVEQPWLVRPLMPESCPFGLQRFRRQIIWVREASVRLLSIRNGAVIQEHAALTDSHELMDCLSDAGILDRAVKLRQAMLADGLSDSPELVIMLSIADIPCLLDHTAPPPQPKSTRRRRLAIPSAWRYADLMTLSSLAQAEDESSRSQISADLPTIDRHLPFPPMAIWHGGASDAENMASVEAARQAVSTATQQAVSSIADPAVV